MWIKLFTAFWFFLPAGIANMTPVFVSKIPILKRFNQPIDFGLKIKGKRLFGAHKTIRGYLTGIIFGILTANLQGLLYANNLSLRTNLLINYQEINLTILGFLLSFGSLFGDSIKSMFKRQLNIDPGKSWFPFDQLDYILGGIVISSIYFKTNLEIYLYIFVIYFILHPISTVLGYLLRLKKDPI